MAQCRLFIREFFSASEKVLYSSCSNYYLFIFLFLHSVFTYVSSMNWEINLLTSAEFWETEEREREKRRGEREQRGDKWRRQAVPPTTHLLSSPQTEGLHRLAGPPVSSQMPPIASAGDTLRHSHLLFCPSVIFSSPSFCLQDRFRK